MRESQFGREKVLGERHARFCHKLTSLLTWPPKLLQALIVWMPGFLLKISGSDEWAFFSILCCEDGVGDVSGRRIQWSIRSAGACQIQCKSWRSPYGRAREAFPAPANAAMRDVSYRLWAAAARTRFMISCRLPEKTRSLTSARRMVAP